MKTSSSLFQITVRRPVAILMIVIAVFVFGTVSYKMLALNLMPDITYPTVTVRTEFEGAAPEEVENNISRRLEQALAVVNNLSSISSISRAGISDVILEFQWGTDVNDAIQDIREKLDQVFLPDEAKKPVILRYDPTLDPIVTFGVSSDKEDLMFLRNYCEDHVKIQLDKIPGVAAVKVRGGLEEEIHVDIDEKKLVSLNLDINRINQRLANENVNLAGGKLKEGSTEYIVRTVNQFENLAEMQNLIVGTFSGVDVRISDIGTVTRNYKDREVVSRINENECVMLEIYKEADANIVSVAESVKRQLLKEKKFESAEGKKPNVSNDPSAKSTIADSMPDHMKVSLLADQSTFIKNSINEVKSNAKTGGFLAILILYLFLRNLKSTVIVSVTIPLSIITTFAFMNFFDVSLNIMSLGGIALGVGMLVDNAIVVLESIFRCQEEGDDIADGTVRGTHEVGTAVVASTLTTVAVFFPIIFVEGIAGQIFKDMSLTVVFALMSSLMFALFFIPMLASRTFKKGDSGSFRKFDYFKRFSSVTEFVEDFKKRGTLLTLLFFPFYLFKFLFFLILDIVGKFLMVGFSLILGIVWLSSKIWMFLHKYLLDYILKGFNAAFSKLQDGVYPKVINVSLNNKRLILLLVLAAFYVTFISMKSLDSELIPTMHQGEFSVIVAFPVGTPIEKTDEFLRPYEEKMMKIEGVDTFFVRIGVEKDSYAKSNEGEYSARIGVKLSKSKNILAAEERVISEIRNIFKDLPDADVKIEYPALFTFKAPVEIEVRGYNLQKLKEYSYKALEELKSIPELKDIEVNIRPGNPEIQIVFNRDALARLNLDLVNVSELVRNQLLGNVATKFIKGDKRIGIRVKIEDNTQKTLEDLNHIVVNPGQTVNGEAQKPIPLAAVADLEVREGPSEIRRIDQQRVGLVTANLSGFGLKEVTEKIRQKLVKINNPLDIEYVIAGQNQEMEKSSNSMIFALLLSVFLVYIVMASQFESLLHPFVIMFTIPLALFGVGVTLYTLDIPLSVIVFIGMMMLAGIVVNNAIVLVDYINLLKEKGMDLRDAIVEAGRVRLRPIIMTTLTTVLGLLPMALGFGEGSEIRKPMAITVISGLIFSTVLTLIVIPTLYEIVESWKVRRQKK